MLAFDLDPGPPATIVECAEVAVALREAFDHFGLIAFPKTSGSKGMQVYVPLNTPGTTYQVTKAFAQGVAQVLADLECEGVRLLSARRAAGLLLDALRGLEFVPRL